MKTKMCKIYTDYNVLKLTDSCTLSKLGCDFADGALLSMVASMDILAKLLSLNVIAITVLRQYSNYFLMQ